MSEENNQSTTFKKNTLHFISQVLLIVCSFSYSISNFLIPILVRALNAEDVIKAAGLFNQSAEQVNVFEQGLHQYLAFPDGMPDPLNDTYANITNSAELIRAASTIPPALINAVVTLLAQALFTLAIYVAMAYGPYEDITTYQKYLRDLNNNWTKILAEGSKKLPKIISRLNHEVEANVTDREKIDKLNAILDEEKKLAILAIRTYFRNGAITAQALTCVATAVFYFYHSVTGDLSEDKYVDWLAENYIKVYALAMFFYMNRTFLEQFIFVFNLIPFATVTASISLAIGSILGWRLGQTLGFAGVALGFVVEECLTSLSFLCILLWHPKARSFHLFSCKVQSKSNAPKNSAPDSMVAFILSALVPTATDIVEPVFFTWLMSKLGDDVLARYESAVVLMVLLNTLSLAIAIACEVAMSKRSNDQVKQYARHSLLITGVLSVVATLAVAVPTYRDNQDLLVVIFAIAALLDMILVTLMSQLRPIKKHHQANFIVAGGQVLGMGVTALAQYLGANEYIIASCFLGYTAAIVGVLFGVWCKALNALPVGAVKREGDCVVDVQDDQEGSGHPLPDAGETSPNNDTPRSPRPLISSCGARRCCLIPPRLSSTSAAASTQPRHEICWARLTCKVSTYFSSANEQDSEGRSLNNVVEERHTVDLSIALLSNV